MEKILASFSQAPSEIVKEFINLATMSSGFMNIEIISKYITEKLTNLGLEPKIDSNQNITAEIKGNLEFKHTVALHTHLDQTKIGEYSELQVEQGENTYNIKSEKSNFAASSYFAIATMLYVASEKDKFEHGPIVLIFTVNDELSLQGAAAIPEWPALSYNYCINLNNFQDCICVGGPLGKNIDIELNLEYKPPENDMCVVNAQCSGLNGGCASDVNANAVQWVSSVLYKLSQSDIPFRIICLESGKYQYTVSTNYELKILVPKDKGDAAVEIIHAAHMASVMEYVRSDHSEFHTEIAQIEPQDALSIEDSLALTYLLSLLPSGVITNSLPYLGFETASNIGKVSISKESKNTIYLQLLAMASGGLDHVYKIVHCAFCTSCLKGKLNETGSWKQWGPRRRGMLFSKSVSVGNEVFGRDIRFGLLPYAIAPSKLCENGYDEATYISIGPKIENFRAIGEEISTTDIEKWSLYVRKAIEALA